MDRFVRYCSVPHCCRLLQSNILSVKHKDESWWDTDDGRFLVLADRKFISVFTWVFYIPDGCLGFLPSTVMNSNGRSVKIFKCAYKVNPFVSPQCWILVLFQKIYKKMALFFRWHPGAPPWQACTISSEAGRSHPLGTRRLHGRSKLRRCGDSCRRCRRRGHFQPVFLRPWWQKRFEQILKHIWSRFAVRYHPPPLKSGTSVLPLGRDN